MLLGVMRLGILRGIVSLRLGGLILVRLGMIWGGMGGIGVWSLIFNGTRKFFFRLDGLSINKYPDYHVQLTTLIDE